MHYTAVSLSRTVLLLSLRVVNRLWEFLTSRRLALRLFAGNQANVSRAVCAPQMCDAHESETHLKMFCTM